MTTNQTPQEPAVLRDSEGAEFRRVDGMQGTRYVEIFLAGRQASTGNVVAACYNPMFTGDGIPASKDAAPQALVEGIDVDKLKTDFGLLGASLNGPKVWTPDWSEVHAGKERDFNGIKAPWVAQLDMKDAGPVAAVTPYQPMTIARDSRMGWNKGTTVMILDDAEGNAWVMKGFQLGLKPQFTYDDFVANGSGYFTDLPAGWGFRVATLEEDLVETPVGGVATILADGFFNVYDKAVPDQTNYKP